MRRLREKDMLETEIGKGGEVTVEGHVIGRLDGFMFAPDASADASEAKALNAAAQKALSGEIETRATKLSQASADHIVLANDGALRWTGDLVGKLIAGDDVLRPRVRIIADEHLTGPARELVQTRLDLWLKTHIEKVLAPLFSLAAADDVTGMARGVAFQLVEALGVLERQKVAEEVKGLDQPSRATLRKYGVRFGAYHIYLPLLLKPAPRSLATQLWALKHESPDAKGVTELLHLASSGRTSIPVDKDTPKSLFRTAGYRVTGERAVRVDILERLADLIRPALSWREGAPGPKPAGVFDGRGFTVTGAMTSLTGASGEDFASILRSLGYRMDRKPKPAEQAEIKQAEPVEAKPAETPAATEIAAIDAPVAAATSSEVPAPAPDAAIESAAQLPEAEVMPAVAIAPVAPEAVQQIAEPAAAETAPAEAAAGEAVAAPAAEAKPDEPAFIEVWRPAGRAEKRPHKPRRPRRPERTKVAAPAAAAVTSEGAPEGVVPALAEASAAEASPQPADRAKDSIKDRERRDRAFRQERRDRKEKAERRDQRVDAMARPSGGGRGRRDKGAQVDRADREQYYAKPHGQRGDRNKQPDPNSPFAKLAALKQQLEQSKEPT
jgi:ATP-dependent RNA helicase SUPV3L1/SUV3